MDGKTQGAAAASAGMSIRTAREWDAGPVPSATKHPRDWRTRPDPFAAVWVTDVEPLLRRDVKGIHGHPPPVAVVHDVEPPRMLTAWAGAAALGFADRVRQSRKLGRRVCDS